jgi:hypothetical protein
VLFSVVKLHIISLVDSFRIADIVHNLAQIHILLCLCISVCDDILEEFLDHHLCSSNFR